MGPSQGHQHETTADHCHLRAPFKLSESFRNTPQKIFPRVEVVVCVRPPAWSTSDPRTPDYSWANLDRPNMDLSVELPTDLTEFEVVTYNNDDRVFPI